MAVKRNGWLANVDSTSSSLFVTSSSRRLSLLMEVALLSCEARNEDEEGDMSEKLRS